MRFNNIKNADEIREELVDMFRNFSKEFRPYDTDVYLYIDEDGNGSLYEFVNPGGNSWLNDDHYLIYTDRQHCDSMFDYYQSISEIADALEVNVDMLLLEVCKANEWCETIEDVTYGDVCDYVSKNEDYLEKLQKAYECFVDSQICDIREEVDAAIERFDEKCRIAEDHYYE